MTVNVLKRTEREIAEAVCEAMLADTDESGEHVPPMQMDVRVAVDELERFLAAASTHTRLGFKAILRLIQMSPSVLLRTTRGFTELTLRERLETLTKADRSEMPLLPLAVVGLKVPITMAAYERGANLALTGFNRAEIGTPRGDVPIPEPAPWPQLENDE